MKFTVGIIIKRDDKVNVEDSQNKDVKKWIKEKKKNYENDIQHVENVFMFMKSAQYHVVVTAAAEEKQKKGSRDNVVMW